MFDLQTHILPAEDDGLRKLALRMGYADAPGRPAKEAFWSDYRNKTDLNRKMLDHLLHDAFGDDAETEAESDLVLDPDPPPERVAEVLGKYPFRDVRRPIATSRRWARRKSASSPRGDAGISWPRSPRGCWRRSPPRPIPTRRW